MGSTITIKAPCVVCDDMKSVEISKSAYMRWNAGEYIQDAAPELPINDREFLISKICGVCFDRLFEGCE